MGSVLPAILLGSVIVGIIIILAALIFMRPENKNGAMNYLEVDNTIKAIDSSIEEMDKAMEEFAKMSDSIFNEIDEKYKELLFLYTLIDNKKEEIAASFSSSVAPPAPAIIKKEPKREAISKARPKPKLENPNLAEIWQLNAQGFSIPEIAKKLELGQGEVKLMLELSKVGDI